MTQITHSGLDLTETRSPTPLDGAPRNPASTIVRFVGAGVLLTGLLCGGFVLYTAWGLLDDQALIASVSAEIDARAGVGEYVDQTLGRFMVMLAHTMNKSHELANLPPTAATGGAQPPFAYFLAWIVVIAVLAVLTRIAFKAISQGASLILLHTGTELPTRRMVQQLAVELHKMNGR